MFTINCPTQVHFGAGLSKTLVAHLRDKSRVAFVGGSASGPVAAMLEQAGIELLRVTVPCEPTTASVNAAFAGLTGADMDAVVACGGGSVIDTGKALAFCLSTAAPLPQDFSKVETGSIGSVPCIAIPTTAGTGAEVTANAVLGDAQAKVSLRGRALFPAVALVDPLLLVGAPRTVALFSGLDAVVQTIEAYTSCKASPFTDALSAPNVGAGLCAVRDVMETDAPKSWERLAWTSLSSGLALANGGLGAVHGLASVLGAVLGAPHGALCGRLLVPALRENLAAVDVGSEAHARIDHSIAQIAEVFPVMHGGDDLSGFEHWMNAQGLPRLADFGSFDIAAVATAGSTASSSQKNAVPLAVEAYARIIQGAL